MYECEDCGHELPDVRLRGNGMRLCDDCHTELARAIGLSIRAIYEGGPFSSTQEDVDQWDDALGELHAELSRLGEKYPE